MQQETRDPLSFLAGGGEMGELTRAKDWNVTPLGNPDTWPQSLCTTLRIILHSSFPMFIFWGPDLICFYNDAYRPSLGKDGKHPSILGMPAKDAWPEIWDIIKPLIDKSLQGEAIWFEDLLVPIYRNGKIEDVYWTFSYSPVNDESGKTAAVLVTCTETTDKVNNSKLLRENTDQLQFAIEAAELGTWDLDAATNTLKANSRLKQWAGLPPNADIDLTWALEIVAEKDRPRVTKAVQEALQYSTGGHYDIEYTIINKETLEEKIVRAKGKAWFNEEKICYRFNGTLQDITTQALAIKKIKESEDRFRTMAETIPEIAWVASPEGGSQSFFNKRFYEYTGMTEEQAHQDWKWESIVHPDMFEARNKKWEHSLNTGEDFYFESLLKRVGDQSYRWHISRAAAIKNEAGEITLWVGTSTDIHEQKLFAQELERQVKQRTKALLDSLLHLQHSNENLEQFASIASHDLQEPLRKIQTFTTLLQQRHQSNIPGEGNVLIDKIKTSSARMSVLISDVLNFSKISIAKIPFMGIDLNEILNNVLVDFELLIQEKKVIINREILPKIEAIPIQMNQLFYNLISNAIKFSDNNKQPVITIFSKKLLPAELKEYSDLNHSHQYYQIIFADNGIGFDKHFAEEIFLIFHRLNDLKKYSGTGIGLALCKKIVANHHGKIYANGEVNDGASFCIILPAKQSYFI